MTAPSVATAIAQNAARHPGKIAAEDSFRKVSYSALRKRIHAAAATAFREPLLGGGQHCGILSKNRIEYLELVAGLPEAGIATATINPLLSAREIQDICNDAKVKVLFVDPPNEQVVSAISFDSVEKIIVFGSQYEEWLAQAQDGAPLPGADQERPFTIPYTSGTTGKPKGVLVSMRSRVRTFAGMQSCYGCFGPDDRFLALAPLCHGAGLLFPLASVCFGGFTRIMDSFDAEQVLGSLNEDSISGVFMVPTHFHRILSLPDTLLGKMSPYPHLRTVISNAAPLPQALKERIITYFGEGLLHETYGSTEGGIVSNLQPADQLRKFQCVGLPFPDTEISIRNDDGTECGAGEIGELFSRSPYLFNGYWQRDGETGQALRDGWCTVGDLAHCDDEGYVYIVDRKKDMIITGGINVYPREIEEILLMHTDIIDAAVVGLADDKWGERIKAFVVTRDGAPPNDTELRRHCEKSLARFKAPGEIEAISQIPRNASGKVLKTELRNRQDIQDPRSPESG